MLRRATTPAITPVTVYSGLEGAGTKPGAVHSVLSITEWRALKARGAMEDNVFGGDGALAAENEPGAESEIREMQEGERRARGQSKPPAKHSGSRRRERQVVKAAEAAEAARKAARKLAKARARAVAKANRKLSVELAGPPVLRAMTAEGSASDMARRRRCRRPERNHS
jgi:hypothetical protein